MKKLVLFLIIPFLFISFRSAAGPGDTIVVQAFTFGSPQDAWFVFPSSEVSFEKILMKYTLKCNPAQNPACGEWDYLTYTYLYKNTGFLDSTLINQPTYTVNGATPASISYMNNAAWHYDATWQQFMVNTATTSLNTYLSGTGSTASTAPFGAASPVSHAQYLWKASEISAAGMSAGNITGLQFYLQSTGSELKNLTIRLKSTTLDSLSNANYSNAGFSTVYSKNTSFTNAGWNSIQFLSPFSWDGTSNLLIDITYDNDLAAINNTVAASVTSFGSGITASGADRVAAFDDYSYVEVPMNEAVQAIDSFVTVAFWCYGSPATQPMNGTVFEAVDSMQNRLLNSHLPWSDSRVYWDAGFSGTGYDRIDKAATTNEIEGKWNYWAFTKNTATGSMKIYLNGVQWHSGTGKLKSMKGIRYFKIGKGNWNGSETYEGKMDEFAVFNKELTQGTIQTWMHKKIDASHPDYNHLALYYHFDDGNYQTFADAAPGNHAPAVPAGVDNPLRDATEITSFSATDTRPNITFERGVYTQYVDSVLVVDSTIIAPFQIITYNDSINNPGVPTSIVNAWPVYYNNYVYDASGMAIDSSLVAADTTLYLAYYEWYKKYPQVLRFELARYITPYGINLSLGDGFTWTFDVSDYRTLLVDSVHLNAGNWQELLDLKFLMIEGTPPREVLSIQNLWNGGFNYGMASDPIDNHLQPISINLPSTALNTRWKSRVTGHGMDTPQNCAEFCSKIHYYKVDGIEQYSKAVWRDNCDLNPVYPQGGTWVYDRANWCPGAEVWTYDWELTPFTTAGTTVMLDHDVQPYTNTGGWDYYQIEDQLVTYGAPNFNLDAAIEDVLAPTTDQMWGRMNPICTHPVIRIKNTGSTKLTSLMVSYGLTGGTMSEFEWTGELDFMEIATVTLNTFEWLSGANTFEVAISKPNGGTDEYSLNDKRITKFVQPLLVPEKFFIELKTNNYPQQTKYTVKDDYGTVLLNKTGLTANTVYKDTLELLPGCYKFELTDSGQDGLSWWANPGQGSGYIRFKNAVNGGIIKNFLSDFGGQVYQQFTVAVTTSIDEYPYTDKATLEVYPNPTDGPVMIDLTTTGHESGRVEISDMLGRKIIVQQLSERTAESLEFDLSYYPRGIYFVNFYSGESHITKKLMVQ